MNAAITATPSIAPAPRLEHGARATGGRAGFSEVLDRGPALDSPGMGPTKAGHIVGQVAQRIDAGRQRLDAIIAQARGGKTFRPGELLAIQAEVQKISEEAALTQKLVEEGMGSVRRLWSMQL